jgi:hypothetical protein
VCPDRVAGERIDRLEHTPGKPDRCARAAVSGGMGAIVGQIINCLSFDRVYIEQTGAGYMRGASQLVAFTILIEPPTLGSLSGIGIGSPCGDRPE